MPWMAHGPPWIALMADECRCVPMSAADGRRSSSKRGGRRPLCAIKRPNRPPRPKQPTLRPKQREAPSSVPHRRAPHNSRRQRRRRAGRRPSFEPRLRITRPSWPPHVMRWDGDPN